MSIINFDEYQARRVVDDLFKANSTRHGEICEWPVIGGHYVSGVDPIEAMKELAYCALLARNRFALNGPPDVPPLPLSHDEREDLKVGGVSTVVALFARSWEGRDYDEEHPEFFDYACGLMASEHAPNRLRNDEELRRRFPPRTLSGLGSGLYWEPPAIHAKTMARRRRSMARSRTAA